MAYSNTYTLGSIPILLSVGAGISGIVRSLRWMRLTSGDTVRGGRWNNAVAALVASRIPASRPSVARLHYTATLLALCPSMMMTMTMMMMTMTITMMITMMMETKRFQFISLSLTHTHSNNPPFKTFFVPSLMHASLFSCRVTCSFMTCQQNRPCREGRLAKRD